MIRYSHLSVVITLMMSYLWGNVIIFLPTAKRNYYNCSPTRICVKPFDWLIFGRQPIEEKPLKTRHLFSFLYKSYYFDILMFQFEV
jgi:hypothetical protein